MDLDQLIRDADPSRDLSIPIPDSSQITRQDLVVTKRRRRRPRLPPAPRTASGLVMAGSVLVVVAVVAVVFMVSGHREALTQSHPVPSSLPPDTSQLAILQRPQTAQDRTLLAVVRRAARLGRVSKPATQSALTGIVRSSMRYAQTLPDGREVFLARVRIPKVSQPSLRFLIVAPDGSWRHGQPIIAPSFGLPDNRIARIEALQGGGCITNNGPNGSGRGLTESSIEPNGVSRVHWQFASQGQGQNNNSKPLILDIPVRGNTAVATAPGLTGCEQPSAITLYNRDGQVIGSRGVRATSSTSQSPSTAQSRVTPAGVKRAILGQQSSPRATTASCRTPTASERAQASIGGADSVFFSCSITRAGRQARFYVQVIRSTGSFIAEQEHNHQAQISGCCVSRQPS